MSTPKSEIRRWLKEAKEIQATHMIVVCDTFSYEDYPVYVFPFEDVHTVHNKYDNREMQRVMEVYSMAIPIEEQLDENRAFHFDVVRQDPKPYYVVRPFYPVELYNAQKQR